VRTHEAHTWPSTVRSRRSQHHSLTLCRNVAQRSEQGTRRIAQISGTEPTSRDCLEDFAKPCRRNSLLPAPFVVERIPATFFFRSGRGEIHFLFSIRLSREGSCRVVHPSTRIQTIWPKNAGFSPMGPSGVTLLRRGGDHAAK